jgi:hemerythrin HHE cation binding domain-containing protein
VSDSSYPQAPVDPAPFTPVPGRARRRSEGLAELSREHHHALAQAMALKRASDESAVSVWEGFLAFWNDEGNEHFVEEEGVLLPAYARAADPDHPIVRRTLLEHILIRAKVAEIEEMSPPPVTELARLGSWLDTHVRLEERVLFPLIEDALPEAALRSLAETLG